MYPSFAQRLMKELPASGAKEAKPNKANLKRSTGGLQTDREKFFKKTINGIDRYLAMLYTADHG